MQQIRLHVCRTNRFVLFRRVLFSIDGSSVCIEMLLSAAFGNSFTDHSFSIASSISEYTSLLLLYKESFPTTIRLSLVVLVRVLKMSKTAIRSDEEYVCAAHLTLFVQNV